MGKTASRKTARVRKRADSGMVLAIHDNDAEKIAELIRAGVSVHGLDVNGCSTVSSACFYGRNDAGQPEKNTASLRVLLEAGALASEDAMNTALNFGRIDHALLLVKYGADPNSKAESNGGSLAPMLIMDMARQDILPELRLLVERGLDVNQIGKFGKTLLMEAASLRRFEVMEYLLDQGADPLVRDHYGMTALLYAALAERFLDDCPCSILMAKQGASLDDKSNSGNGVNKELKQRIKSGLERARLMSLEEQVVVDQDESRLAL